MQQAIVLAFALCTAAAVAEPLSVGTGLPQALFQMREMDMHLHSGMERPLPLEAWLDLAVKDGRKVAVLLDHIELYRKTPEEYRAWREEKQFHAEYPVGQEGHTALFADFAQAAERDDLIVFTGWEVSETELDTGLELEAMRRADVLGFHISPRNGYEAPNGQTLLKRARQVKELQQELQVPMILFHPFTMRDENLQRTAQKEGRPVEEITAEEYRFFQPGEQEELAEVLRGTSIYIEISRASEQYMDNAACREALISDIRPLTELGVQFTISTDAHGLEDAERRFEPDKYCAPLGITPANTNTIVRELLALRARRQLLEREAAK